jgi:hypothetical protein
MRSTIKAAFVAITIAVVALAGGSSALATQGDNHKVVVCKYVGTPGPDERLQTGNNPIVVSVNALSGFDGTFPFEFNDAQGRSVAIRYALNSHDGSIEECQPSATPQPTSQPSPVPSVEPSPSPTSTASPSDSPSPSPSSSSTPAPSASPRTEPSTAPSPTPTLTPTASPPPSATSSPVASPLPTAPATDTEEPTAPPSDGPPSPLLAVVGLVCLLYGVAETLNRIENKDAR